MNNNNGELRIFEKELQDIISRFCRTTYPNLYLFARDITNQLHKVYVPVFYGPIVSIASFARVWHSESGMNQFPPNPTWFSTNTANPTHPTDPPNLSIPTSMTILPVEMFDRLPPLGMYPYSTWGMARSPGHTLIERIYADTDPDRNDIATIVVPLQWFPRPLGKRQPMLSTTNSYVSRTFPTTTTTATSMAKTGFESTSSRDTGGAKGPGAEVGAGTHQENTGDISSPNLDPGAGQINDPSDSDARSTMTAPPSNLPSSIARLGHSTWEAVTISCSSCHEPSWIADYRTLIFCEGWVGGTECG
jgi:hypothetical protein